MTYAIYSLFLFNLLIELWGSAIHSPCLIFYYRITSFIRIYTEYVYIFDLFIFWPLFRSLALTDISNKKRNHFTKEK